MSATTGNDTTSIALGNSTPTKRRFTRSSNAAPLRGLTPLIVGLVVWQIFGDPDSPFFPPPSTWATAVSGLYADGTLLPALGATLRSLVISLAVATIVGAVIGILVGASKFLDKALGPTLEFFRATPSSAMVPIGVLLLGYTLTMKVTLTALAALWPILLNTRAAMREINPVLMDVASAFRMTPWRRVQTIIMPSVSTAILLGIRVGAPVAIIVTLLVEILTGITGIGALLAQSQQEYDSESTFGLLVLIGIVALVFNFLVTSIESFFTRHLPPKS